MRDRLGLDVRNYLLILVASLVILLNPVGSQAQSKLDHDTEWLAYNIYHEARGEPVMGKVAVAIVTLNRVTSPTFPNTIHGVITQKGQFSWYWDDKPDAPGEPKAYQECFIISKAIVSLWKSGTIDKIIRQSGLDGVKWYHSEKVDPYWSTHFQFVTKIGGHLVYKET